MLNLEDFMNIRDLKQQGWSVSAIAAELNLDRKTVRKHLLDAPQPYKRENPAPCKIDPYRSFLKDRLYVRVSLPACTKRFPDGGTTQLGRVALRWKILVCPASKSASEMETRMLFPGRSGRSSSAASCTLASPPLRVSVVVPVRTLQLQDSSDMVATLAVTLLTGAGGSAGADGNVRARPESTNK